LDRATLDPALSPGPDFRRAKRVSFSRVQTASTIRVRSSDAEGLSDMKFIPRTILAMALAAISTALAPSALWAASNPFVGDWKLDPTRSKLTDVMKVKRVNSKKYIFDFGVDSPETIVIDGTDQSGFSGTTLSVSAELPDAWKVVRKKDGRMLLTATWKLSKDGNMLTDNFNQISPNGSTSTVDYVYQRKGQGSGFAGTWISTSAVVNFVYVLQIRPYEEDGLSIINSASQLTKNMKQDGKDYPNIGANAAVIAASSLRRLDERTLELTDKKSDGKVYDTQQIKLSSDLKALTISIHTAGRDEPNIFVFERQ
jgi:hypothetical protein